MKARTLLKKLTDYGLSVQVADDKIRLSPRQLINDKVLAFVRTHKNDLICALNDENRERKRTLHQGRLEVLRVIMRRYLKTGDCTRIIPTDYEIEDYIDWVLLKHGYDLEDAITTYRNITPEPVLTCKCGYLPPFCSCGGIAAPRMVSCSQCANFTPDVIGNGMGIGTCTHGIERTRELNGCISLYRYANRHCAEFSKSENHGIKLS